jgi:hypothetical protein
MTSLRRLSDGAGDIGGSSLALKEINGKLEVVGHEPVVGVYMRVGSIGARTYSQQDWWQTNEITEIIEERKFDKEHYVKFKTKSGSIYEWRNT